MNDTVSDILNELGLTGPLPQAAYVERVRQFGEAGERFLQQVDRSLAQGFSPGLWREIYAAQNADPELSRLITAHTSAPLHAAILNWLDTIPAAPRSFAEIGCNNGLLTLALARLWPQADALGVDSEPDAIAVARRLAMQHRQENVQFYCADLTQADAVADIEPAEWLLAPFLFHEVLAENPDPAPLIANLQRLLAQGGRLITINRFPPQRLNPQQQAQQLKDTLAQGGWKPLDIEWLQVGAETFPAVVFG